MESNLAGNWKSATPVLILGGLGDAVVRPDAQTELATRLCQQGSGIVKQQMYPNGTHYNVMALGRAITLQWLAGSSKTQISDCSRTTP